jgi:hypothetical protein
MVFNDNAGCLNARVIVNDHREQARSYSITKSRGVCFHTIWMTRFCRENIVSYARYAPCAE